MSPSLFLAATLMTPAADPTAEDRARADEAIHKYLAAETRRLSERFMDGARTKAEWEARRPKLKEQFLDMLGLWPLPEKTPLKATVTGTLERGDVTIEKLHFQSKPGLYVTGNLYRPKAGPANPGRKAGGAPTKLPAILYVCGHTNKGRDGNKTAFQDHGLWFASNGYVCLVVDTLQLGEVAGIHHGTYREGRWWWHSRGYTPAGVECWNGIRAIDYLLTRNDVDPERIGVTGISGGGATTVWIAAADDRVKVAVPVSGMSDLESYVTNKVINGHCDCMFFINTYQWEWTTALMLHAPKPLLFANSDNDTIFPMDGNRRVIERLRKGYELLGKKENVEEYVSKGGHAYRPDLRVAVFAFLNKHLKGDTGPVKDADFPTIAGKDLRVFPEDKDLPKDQINDRVDELFVPKAEVKLPAKKEDFAAWKAGLVKKLHESSFRTLPEKWKTSPVFREEMIPGTKAVLANSGFGPDFCVELLRDKSKPQGIANVVLSEAGKEVANQLSKLAAEDEDLLAVFPRGTGPMGWTRKNPPNTTERSLVLLGGTADSGRILDLVAYLHTSEAKTRTTLIGKGPDGILCAYASLLSPRRPDRVILVDPPASHRDGPHFLNVDRVLDLPTALGLLAPDVKLTLVNARDKAFDKTAAIYKLAGAEGKFERK